MYENFYGFSRLPFQLLPDPDFFYRSQKHEKALTCLEYGVFEKAGFIVITGEIGTGKTTLLRYILRSLTNDLPIALLNQTFLPPEDFLRTLCQEFSLPHEGKGKSELIELFGTFLIDQYQQGRYVTLILDEAQNLPLDTLEEIRMLSNLDADSERLLQIILVGQPSLRNKLHREELRQLLQRVEVSYHLEPLDREEIRNYIHYRLKTAGADSRELFEESAIETIFEYTGGVPRLINLLCHRSLVYGFADDQKIITLDLVEKMLEDRKAEGIYPESPKEPPSENEKTNNEQSNLKKDSAAAISQNQLTATLSRLTELSETSMKVAELSAAKAADSSSDFHLSKLKGQLAQEIESRKTLEQRLARAEDNLDRLRNTLSQHDSREASSNSADMESNPGIGRLLDPGAADPSSTSSTSRRNTILIVVFILILFWFTGFVIWQLFATSSPEKHAKRESKVLKYSISKQNPKPAETDSTPTPLENGLSEAADAAVQVPTSEKTVVKNINNQADGGLKSSANTQPPAESLPEVLKDRDSKVLEEIKAEKYICVVRLANVRAGPNINTSIIGRIRQGTEVEVIGKEGNWLQLKNQDGKSAWIYGNLLRPQE